MRQLVASAVRALEAVANRSPEVPLSTKEQTKSQHDQERAELTEDDLEQVVGGVGDRPTEEVAFYYNRIAFSYSNTVDGKS